MNGLTKMMCGLAAMGAAAALWAVEVTPEQAETAVRNWIRRNPRSMTARFTSENGAARTFAKGGKALFHVVQLEGGGFVVTSGDTKVSPIVAFSDGGSFDDDSRNPLFALLNRDMAGRLDSVAADSPARKKVQPMVSKSASQSSSEPVKTDNEQAWDELLAETDARKAKSISSTSQLGDVRVEPMLKTEWDQSTWGRGQTKLNTYNYYTPNHYVCGCVATAGAQIMKFWEYPKTSVTAKSFNCTVDGSPVTLKMRGGTYAWSSMPLKYDSTPNITEAQRQAIGQLTYDVGVASGMSYTDGNSGTQTSYLSATFRETFGYKSAKAYFPFINIGTGEQVTFKNALLASLDGQMPAALSIGGSAGGHCIVADGYGFHNGKTLYVHLNCGWSGKYWSYGDENVWYMIFDENLTRAFKFSVLKGIVANINPTESGDVISGRVLDHAGKPVSGAMVTMKKGTTSKVSETNSKGIYFFRVTSTGSYAISAKHGEEETKISMVEIQKLSSDAVFSPTQGWTSSGYSANKWGVDLTLESASKVIPDNPVVEKVAAPVFSPNAGSFTQASLSVTLSCGTSGAMIYYTRDGTTPTTSSTKYTGAVTITSTTTFRAIAVKSGMANSDVVVKTYTKNKPAISVANALDDASRTYTVSDSANAYGQDDVTHDGTDALRLSCAKTSGAKTSVTASFSGAGTLSFWWCDPSATAMYSTDTSTIIGYNNYYYCTVTKSDGTEYGQWKCSGPSWEKCEIPLMAGTYTIEWSVSAGSWIYAAARTSYLDEVSFVPYSGGARKVTFSANGGSGVPETPSVTAAFGEFVKVSGQGTLARDGCKFVGWSTSSDASKAEYDIGESVQVGAVDVPLYAVWKKWIPVLVEIPQAGGESVQPLSLYGNSYVAYISFPSWANNFKMTGKTSSGGTTTLNLSNGRSHLSISGDLSLTFSADANDTAEDRSFDLDMDALDYPYVIRFHVMQKADVTSSKAKYLVIENESGTDFSSGMSITGTGRENYVARIVRRNSSVNDVAASWSIVSGGAYASISSDGTVTANDVSSVQYVTVRATYTEDGVLFKAERELTIEPRKVYTVTLGKNGGTGGDDRVTATYGQPMPTPRTAPKKDGYVFEGYWTTTGAGGVQYYADANGDRKMESVRNWDKMSAMTLWAKWRKAAVVKVTLGKNGGTGGDDYVTCTEGQPMPTPRTAPKKEGYIFAGYWTTTGAGGVQYYADADGDRKMESVRKWDKASATTLWAKWRKAAVVKVTFGKNGGTGGDDYVTCTEGKPMPTPRTAPKRTGWTFAGYWDTLAQDANGNPKGRQYYDANMKSVRNWDKTSAVTLWAKWTVRVKLGKNGGTGGDDYVTVTYNQPFPKRTMPTRTGYTFGGYWVSSSSKTGQCYNTDGTGTSSMKWTTGGTPTVWALWTPSGKSVKKASARVTASEDQEGGSVWEGGPIWEGGCPQPPPDAAELWPAGTYTGVVADGAGWFMLQLDGAAPDGSRTAFLALETAGGSVSAECEAEAVANGILLVAEDGGVCVIDLAAGIAIYY